MGVYFGSTSEIEDAEIILNGIKDGQISKDFIFNEKKVWIPNVNGKVVLNNVPGILTERGRSFIMIFLQNNGKISSTLL